MKQKKVKKRVWIIVSLLILIGLAAVIPILFSTKTTHRHRTIKGDLKQIHSASLIYESEHGRYPDNLKRVYDPSKIVEEEDHLYGIQKKNLYSPTLDYLYFSTGIKKYPILNPSKTLIACDKFSVDNTGIHCLFADGKIKRYTAKSLDDLKSQGIIIPHEETVRVAAIQCYSEMGKTEQNLKRIIALVKKAAKKGAKIIVTPECAVQGYAYPPTWKTWLAKDKSSGKGIPVEPYAETIPGPITDRLAKLSGELGIYLCVSMVEKAASKDPAETLFYNAQVLFTPKGKLIAHHRKKALWGPGDSSWCTKGDRSVQVVHTKYGVLGLMICYDFHILPPILDKGNVDIVLYSVGWYGPNEETWFTSSFPRKAVIPYKHHVILSNWSAPAINDTWPGCGYSCIIDNTGKTLAINKTHWQETIVIADLPIKK